MVKESWRPKLNGTYFVFKKAKLIVLWARVAPGSARSAKAHRGKKRLFRERLITGLVAMARPELFVMGGLPAEDSDSTDCLGICHLLRAR